MPFTHASLPSAAPAKPHLMDVSTGLKAEFADLDALARELHRARRDGGLRFQALDVAQRMTPRASWPALAVFLRREDGESFHAIASIQGRPREALEAALRQTEPRKRTRARPAGPRRADPDVLILDGVA